MVTFVRGWLQTRARVKLYRAVVGAGRCAGGEPVLENEAEQELSILLVLRMKKSGYWLYTTRASGRVSPYIF